MKLQKKMTTLYLIDFHTNDDKSENQSPSQYLFNYLKNKIGMNLKSFSKQYHKIQTLLHSSLKLYTCYDIVIYKDLIILGGNRKLHLFNRFTSKYKKSINTLISTHGMHIYESFLLMTGVDTDGHSKCFKFDLNILLSNEEDDGLIWKTQVGILQSSWGVSVLDNLVYVVDLSIFAFDIENGERVSDPIFVPEMDIGSGFGIVFTPEREMVLSRTSFFALEASSPLEMYKINEQDGKWYLINKPDTTLMDRGSYGIFYEKSTDLIYQVDRKAKRVNMFQKQFEKLIRVDLSFPLDTIYHYAIAIDEKTGQLILPIVDGSAQIFN